MAAFAVAVGRPCRPRLFLFLSLKKIKISYEQKEMPRLCSEQG